MPSCKSLLSICMFLRILGLFTFPGGISSSNVSRPKAARCGESRHQGSKPNPDFHGGRSNESKSSFCSVGCSNFALAQRPTKINLGEGEAQARKILLEKAAKEGRVFDSAAPAAATVTCWSGVISWGGRNYQFNMLGHNPRRARRQP